jgi:hypothetical protein
MSYTQRFKDSIYVEGTTSASYPASEHGGTMRVPYSRNVSVDITVDVETSDFDSSVVYCNRSLDGLTGSVVAMNAAQCAAIQQTAGEVSQALIDGFFGTIRMELSQQIQALDSAIKAGFGLIQEQGKAVSAQKNTMETDYNRISSRYITIFQDLDNECYKRIYALDKNSFNLAWNIQKKLLVETNTNITAKNLLGIQDESSSKSMMMVSRINRLTLDVLKTLGDYIYQETTIAALINSFMTDEAVADTVYEYRTEYVPVIWVSRENPESGVSEADCYMPENMSQTQKEMTAGAANRRFTTASESEWTVLREDEKTTLDKEFKVIAESVFSENTGEKDVRVYDMIMELWQNTSMSSLSTSSLKE